MKRQHPIRKMLAALDLHNAATTTSPNEYQRAVARHIKPLLDELERGIRVYYPAGPNQRKASDLLAAWKEEL